MCFGGCLIQLAIRRIDSEQYSAWEEMMNDMDLFYSEHEATLNPVGLIERGCLYASQIDGIWARVELIAYTENGDVSLILSSQHADFLNV